MLRNKVIVLFFCLIAMAGGCRKKPAAIVIVPDVQKNHLQRNHIFGKVKTLNTETFILHADSLTMADSSEIPNLLAQRTPETTAIQHYSSDGFLLQYVKLNTRQDTLLRREYHYDSDALGTTWEEYDSARTLLTRGKYLYDRNRFPAGEQIFRDDSIVMAFSYITDGVGNIIRSNHTFGDCSIHTENKYNKYGLIARITEYEPNGKMFKTAEIEYDNYGDEVNRRVYKAGRQLLEYTYHQYSQDGRLLKTIYEDNVHNIRETSYYSDFDSLNNWQTEIRVRDRKIITVRKRTIIYY